MAPQTRARLRESAINALADRQHGVVSRRQLLDAGVKNGAIKRRLEAGRLWPIHRGVYAVGRPRLDRSGERMAAVLAFGDGAVLSHRSAAAHWGFWRGGRGPIDVTSGHGRCGRPGLRLHECQMDEEEVTTHRRIPVTTPARTLFDLAEAVDWSRLNGASEEADRLHLLQMRELERVVERGWGRHSLKPIRPIVDEARHAETTRSPLEQRFLAFCEAHGIPQPTTNVELQGREVDALWPDARVIAELDSWEFHSHRSAFEGDRSRLPRARPGCHPPRRRLSHDSHYQPTPST